MENFKILIVDDEAVFRKILKLQLKDFDVYEAEDGAAGLKMLEKHSDNIFLVISDIMMPVMDGIEFLQIAKNKYPLIEFIMLTGASTDEVVINALQHGASSYLCKPLNLPELKFIVNKSLEIFYIKKSNYEYINKMSELAASENEVAILKSLCSDLREELISAQKNVKELKEFMHKTIDADKIPKSILKI